MERDSANKYIVALPSCARRNGGGGGVLRRERKTASRGEEKAAKRSSRKKKGERKGKGDLHSTSQRNKPERRKGTILNRGKDSDQSADAKVRHRLRSGQHGEERRNKLPCDRNQEKGKRGTCDFAKGNPLAGEQNRPDANSLSGSERKILKSGRTEK